MAKLNRNIKYINKDFNSFKNSLIELSKTYFPDTHNDFTNSSTGMLFIEMASYIGDVLSFYMDNQIQENFIQHARQTENIFNLSYFLGYQPKVTTAASTEIDFYQLVPANNNNPDYNFSLLIPENTVIGSNYNNIQFIIDSPIDFSFSSSFDPTEVSIYQNTGNSPDYFVLKKTRKAISSSIKSTQLNFDSPSKFISKTITDENIIGILDVIDSDGNVWYEVPNLAQETIFNKIKNTSTKNPYFTEDPNTPYLLKLIQTQRRFVARFLNFNTLQLQFGAGNVNDKDEEIIPNPDNIGTGLPFSKTKLNTAYSPVNFMFTNTYGIAPSNTTLTVRYLVGGGNVSNIESNSLTEISTNQIKFQNPGIVVSQPTLSNFVLNSLRCNNSKAADGGSNGDTLEEIKHKALNNFQTQLRTVTKEDYLIRTLSLPSEFGSIAKAYITSSKVSTSENVDSINDLELYVLAYDNNKNLILASKLLKENLKTYLSEYRMINDSIKIKDAFIINIGVNFEIVVSPGFNNNEVLLKCIDSLKQHFNINNWQINEPIFLKKIYLLLDKIEGVQMVNNVEIINKSNSILGYSDFVYDVKNATQNNVIYPSIDPMIFEIKYPNTDIKGKISGL